MSTVEQIKYTKHGNSSILSNMMIDNETGASEIPPSPKKEIDTLPVHQRRSDTSAAERLDIVYANMILSELQQGLFSVLNQCLSTASTADIGQLEEPQILSVEGEIIEQLRNPMSSLRIQDRAYFGDNEFTYHAVSELLPTPSQESDEITLIVDREKRKMSLEAARGMISESHVNPKDPLFSLGGKARAKQGTVLESEHDKEIYGLER
ncbi:MAG: hypothetical protein KGY80_13160 [Candidatus Thorarchaeota archaeon]|nr:hypothetical protein [Candidatus Thorarchaeota archaeon]